jgi:tetratricopeptide (TPR) repeat protein/capsular polysaccharide biosynthesis protein
MEIKDQLSHQNQITLVKESYSPDFYYNWGVHYANLGQDAEAKGCYLQAIALKADYYEAYFNLATIYEAEGNVDKAIAYYQDTLNHNPAHLDACNALGYLFQKEKKFEQAFKYYHQALEIDPLWSGIHNNLGFLYLCQDKLDQALHYLKRAVELDGKLAIAHYNLGTLWLKNQNHPQALACFEQVIALQPDNLKAYNDAAVALINLGKIEAAWEKLAQIIHRNPTWIKGWLNRVKQLEGADILDKSQLNLAAFFEGILRGQKWSEIADYLYHSYLYKGDVFLEYGSYQIPQLYYQIALQFNQKNIEVYLRLGKCLTQQKRLQSAILVYRFALSIAPDHPKILFQLAQTLTQAKHFEEATKYYQQLIQLPDTEKISIFPSLTQPTNPPTPPKGIYLQTKTWLQKNNLKSYISVNWGRESVKPSNHSPYPLPTPEKKIPHQCEGVNCVSCMRKLCDIFQPQPLATGVYVCEQTKPFELDKPETFVAMIPQGRAWVVPQQSHWLICNAIAIITPDNHLLADLSRFYPWKLPNCEKHDPKSHPIFFQDKTPPLTTLTGNVVMLSTLAAHVYYHWLIDLIPRVGMMLRSGINLDKVDYFVVNNLDRPYQKETLTRLGIPLDKVIESDRHPHIQAQRLIVPSWPGDLDWPLSGSLNFLRETFLQPQSSKQYPKRIYISRAKSRHRHVINEPEVLESISQYGFIPIFLETLPLSEQIALFNNAEYIIAPHGSGLTNLVFCNPHTTIIEFFAPRYVRSDYLIISQQLQLKHYYLLGENFEAHLLRELMYESAITDDILIKLESLKSLLNLIFSQN